MRRWCAEELQRCRCKVQRCRKVQWCRGADMDYGDAEVLRCRGAEMQIWRIEMMNCRDAEIQRCRRVQRYTKHRCRGADMENREAEVRRYRQYDGEYGA